MKLEHWTVGLLCFGLLGCGNDPEPPVAEDGELLYMAPHEDGNTFACGTCHALSEPAEDAFTRPGHAIGDAANRPSYKNGQLTTFLDAVNNCRRDWLNTTEFGADDPRWLALEGYLKEQAGDAPADALVYEIVDPPSDVNGGDHIAGETRFNTSCAVCHGQGAVGTERAPAIAGTMLPGDFIAEKVRRSGNPESEVYPGLVIGRMPFWAADRQSDDQLRDLIAFLAMSEPAMIPTATGDEVDLSLDGAQTGCGMTHAKVGQSLTFQTNAHAVAGTATISDDCTILFENFSFDGGGINVHVIAGTGGNYEAGADVSINMVGTAFDGGSALVRLPAGVTLDDFDGLSIWCVPVGFSFGDGLLQ
jgi:mono/diheme cytochrome c family protein